MGYLLDNETGDQLPRLWKSLITRRHFSLSNHFSALQPSPDKWNRFLPLPGDNLN